MEEITPESHDKIIAYTSNLPHAAAAALINSDRFSGQSCWFIGGGFRDVTRIADINAGLWSDLFLENRENVLSELENFRTQIETLQKLINENNREGLQEFAKCSLPQEGNCFMSIIRVNLGAKSYNIEIAAGLLDTAGEKIRSISKAQRAAVISDSNVDALYGERLQEHLQAAALK